MDTIIPELESLRVHIAPVGFEIDRVVIPAKRLKADKVWLLIHDNPAEDKAAPFVKKIKSELKKSKIKSATISSDRMNLFAIIKSIRGIIEEERGNNIYVNVASGSKIQSIGCMMACMTIPDRQNVRPFYAEAEEYSGFKGQQQSSGVKNVKPLPTFEIHTPRYELIKTLNIIKDHGGKITKKELAKIADESKIIRVNAREGNYSAVRYTTLDKNIIQPLKKQWNLITVEKVGRNHHVSITEEGRNVVEFLND